MSEPTTLLVRACNFFYPLINRNENEDGGDDDDFFDDGRHEDVVGHELGREVDPVGAAADGEPDDGHEAEALHELLLLEELRGGGDVTADVSGQRCFPETMM